MTPTLWWNDDFPSIDIGITFGQCVSEMALAGFEGCSVGHKYPTDTAVLQSELELRGLHVSEPWASTYFTINDMEEHDAPQLPRSSSSSSGRWAARTWSSPSSAERCTRSRVAVFANKPVFDDEQWDALAAGLNQLGEIAKAEGMRLCYHHHMGTGVMTRPELDRLMAATDPELVHLLLDTGHMAFAGDDPLDVAKTYAERIRHVHLKDVRTDVVKRGPRREPVVPGGRRGGRVHRPGRRRDRLRADPRRRSADSGVRGLAGRRGGAGPRQGAPAGVRDEGPRLPARRPRVVSATPTRPELYFSFFMFTVDLRPEDAAYRRGDRRAPTRS